MTNYRTHIASGKATPQSQKAKPTQVRNRAGGYGFKVDDWARLSRFLILGCDKGTYYANAKELTFENYEVVKNCLAADHKRTINTIVDVSKNDRAPKNSAAIFALAVCSVFGSEEAKAMANRAMPEVARYSTDMFTWVADVLSLKGAGEGKKAKKGMGFRRALGRWYTEKDAVRLAYQLCKYPSRALGDGKKIAHADLLRLARPVKASKGSTGRNGRALTIPSEDHATLFQYAVHGVTTSAQKEQRLAQEELTGKKQKACGISSQKLTALRDTDLRYVYGHEMARKATSTAEIVRLIGEYDLTRESIPPRFRNEMKVQRALLPHMPYTALVRNLGGMTSSGLLKELGDETASVIEKLENREALKKARVHPMSLLLAYKVYGMGHGDRTSWMPVPAITGALEKAFYASFDYMEPTGKKFFVACDSSGSMWYPNFTEGHTKLFKMYGIYAAEAAACIAMAIARSEKNAALKTFSGELKDWEVTSTDNLSAVVKKLQAAGAGGTDVSAPMRYAYDHGLDVDLFVVLTDNETWMGGIHPHEALIRYREKFNPKAKMAVLAFTATNISVADPDDPGMIDFVGLDASVPKLLAEFASDRM
jgi:60 kDa SS-A/Ro ribonucleoprotein